MEYDNAYDYAYDPAGTRVIDRHIYVSGITGDTHEELGLDWMSVHFITSFDSPLLVQGREATETYSGAGYYNVVLDSGGVWKLAGSDVNWNVDTPVENFWQYDSEWMNRGSL